MIGSTRDDAEAAEARRTRLRADASAFEPEGEGPMPDRFALATWAFVALGVTIRLVRYLRNPPLWGDEAMVAVNVLERGYLDLLRPLRFFQVCPALFLWIERAAVDVLGPSELALRLWPTACAVASVFLFRHMAARLLGGVPLLLAVAAFAVAFYPIRHGGEVKPYAGDLFASLALVALAVEWWRGPGQAPGPRKSRWLWALAALVPFALAMSHPSVFVAGGVALALLPGVWKSGNRRTWGAYAAYGLAMVSAFGGLFLLSTGQMEEIRAGYREGYWADAFPPLGEPLRLAAWLLLKNTGEAFAYPVGGENGASVLTTILFVAGAIGFWRRGRKEVVLLALAPFGLTLLASAIGRYPYGGSARTMQHLAPLVCLLAGYGAGLGIDRIAHAGRRARVLRLSVLALALLGSGLLVRDLVRPYRFAEDEHSRAFARWFWDEIARDAEVCCARSASGSLFEGRYWNVGRLELYISNRRFQGPEPLDPARPDLEAVSEARPLRCVVYNESPEDSPALAAWLSRLDARFDLRSRRTYVVNAGVATKGLRREERYEVLEYVPGSDDAEVIAKADGPPLP